MAGVVVVVLFLGALAQAFFTFAALEYAAKTHNVFVTYHFDAKYFDHRFQTFAVRYDWEEAPNDATRTVLSVGWPMLWLVSERTFELDPPTPGMIQLRPTWTYPHAAVPGLSRGRVKPFALAVNSLVFAAPMLAALLLWIRSSRSLAA